MTGRAPRTLRHGLTLLIRNGRGGLRFGSGIAEHVGALRRDAQILELGSGPGLLAECILERCHNVSSYTLLDFSPHMLAVSRERLARFPAAEFVFASFRSEDWIQSVAGPFACIVSMQAVHELRHKRYARRLYAQAYEVTAHGGRVLICDHVPLDDTPRSEALYILLPQRSELNSAGPRRPSSDGSARRTRSIT